MTGILPDAEVHSRHMHPAQDRSEARAAQTIVQQLQQGEQFRDDEAMMFSGLDQHGCRCAYVVK